MGEGDGLFGANGPVVKIDRRIESGEGNRVVGQRGLAGVLNGETKEDGAAEIVVGDGGGAAAAEEKTAFNVVLKNGGASKLNVVKIVKDLTGLGLKEAKDLVDGAPKNVKEGVSKAEAEEIAAKLKEAGADVEIA